MWSMRGLLAVVLVGGLLAIPVSCYWEFLTRGMRPPVGTQILDDLEKNGFPDLQLKKLDGTSVRVSDFKGKVLLVNIWATWCAPCVKEIPSLKRLVEKFSGKLVVLAISHDRDAEDIDSFVKAFGGLPKNFIIVWDKERVTTKLLGTDALPETYILTPEQKVIRKVAGETLWDAPMAIKFFEEVFDPSKIK